MKVTFPDFHQSNVLVVGDIILDRYWYGSSNCISSEAPVPILKINVIEERPGGAANVAVNISSLGANARLIGLTGIDDAARSLKEKLIKLNVFCDFISVSTYHTVIKLRVISKNQQLIRLDFEQNSNNVNNMLILKKIKLELPKIGALVLSDYNKSTLLEVQKIIALARNSKVPVLIDPKGTDFSRYFGATLLTPNLSEFEAIVGSCTTESQLISRGMSIINTYSLSALLITRSSQGMTLLQSGKDPLHFPTQAQEVYDVTGAGDTVIGVLAASLSAGKSLEDSCFLANIAAGIVVGKFGTSSVSLIDLKNAINNFINVGFGIITEEELQKAVTLAKQRGEKLVMTNGIFDIIHAGHIDYLTHARSLGDRLIVAVNSDSSTKHLKGEHRPINSLVNRMTVLSALKSVDWVVSFNELTPQRLISNILPDLLVKGGDYNPNEISGSKEVLLNGGNVQVLKFKNGYSSSKIIDIIKNMNIKK